MADNEGVVQIKVDGVPGGEVSKEAGSVLTQLDSLGEGVSPFKTLDESAAQAKTALEQDKQERAAAGTDAQQEKSKEQAGASAQDAQNKQSQEQQQQRKPSRKPRWAAKLTHKANVAESEAERYKREAEDYKRQLDEAKAAKQPEKKEQRYFYKPPPVKPEFKIVTDEFVKNWTRFDLEQHRDQARAVGDEAREQSANAALREWDLRDRWEKEQSNWQIQEGSKHDEFLRASQTYAEKLKAEYPDFWDTSSELHRAAKELVNDPEIAHHMAALLEKPDGGYVLAQFAEVVLDASRADALAEENQQLKKELETFKKSRQPVAASEGTETVASANGKDSGESPKKALMRGLGELNLDQFRPFKRSA